MNCNEALKYYEQRIQELKNEYTRNIKKCDDNLEAAQDSLITINNGIAFLCDDCKSDYMKNYTNYAIDELSQYLEWFSVSIEKKESVERIKHQEKIEKINELIKLREKTSQLIEEIQNEKKRIENNYRHDVKQITDATVETYKNYSDIITTDLNLSGKIPSQRKSLPTNVCVGNILKPNEGVLRNISSENILRYPFEINMRNGKNVIINTSVYHNNEQNDNIFAALLLRYLESFPSGSVKIGVVSYVTNTKLLQILNALSNTVIVLNDKVVDNPRDKDRLLAMVMNSAQEISNSLSKNFSPDLHSLYEKDIKGDCFQLVFLKDVLRGTNEEGLKTILNLIEAYYTSGVRVLWMDDFSENNLGNQSLQYKEIVKRILGACDVVTLTENGYVTNNAQVELLSLSNSCLNSDIYSYCVKYKEYLASMQSSRVSFEDIGFGENNRFDENDATISIPVAWNAPNVWNIEFNCQNDDPIANLIVGIPGTGKSHFIDAIILNGAWKYSPDELVFQLIDFKDGLASSAYADDRCKIPHIKVVSRKNKQEEAEIILSGILAEKELRALKCAKLGVGNIAAYNRKSSEKMPRLVVIVDECQHLFDDEYLSKMSEQIVREGRAMGIHLVLATQTVTSKMMKTIAFVNGRYCFQTSSDTELGELIGKEYKSRFNEVEKSTHLVFAKDWKDGGKVKKITPAFDGDSGDDYTCRSKYARQIREKWSNYPIDIFDVSDLSPVSIENVEYKAIYKDSEKLEIPVGLNYQNRSIVSIKLESKKQNAILLIGTNEKISNGIISSIITKSVIDKIKLCYIGKGLSPEIQMGLNVLLNNNLAKSYSCEEYILALKDVYRIYKERRQKTAQIYEPIIFIFDGLQNMDAFTSNLEHPSKNTVASPIPVETSGQHLSYRERRELRAQNKEIEQEDSLKVFGKNSFIELLGNAYSVNIFICATFDSIGITSANGKLFGYNDNRLLGACDYKFFFPSFDSDEIKSVMDSRFKETVLNGLDENLCFMSENTQKGKRNLKLKVFDYSNIEKSNIDIFSEFWEE